MDDAWLRFVVAALACWRVSALLAYDDGPWDLVVALRRAAGSGALGRMLDCFRCTSLWVAAPLALAVGQGLTGWLLTWLGLSGAACLLDRVGQPPLRLEPDNQGDEHHGLLWTESRDTGRTGASQAPGAAADTPPRASS